MTIFIDYRVSDKCNNPDSCGEICVKCGKCGRKFEQGTMIIDNTKDLDKLNEELKKFEKED